MAVVSLLVLHATNHMAVCRSFGADNLSFKLSTVRI